MPDGLDLGMHISSSEEFLQICLLILIKFISHNGKIGCEFNYLKAVELYFCEITLYYLN